MPDYVALRQVKHNGEKYTPGQVLTMTEKEAARLLKMKSVSKVEAKAKGADAKGGSGDNGKKDPPGGQDDKDKPS